jgi:hypothetical protein
MRARKVPSRLDHGSPDIQLVAPADPTGDAAFNDEWDLLIRLATQAWAGHDLERLDVLEQTVVRLRAWIGRDLIGVNAAPLLQGPGPVLPGGGVTGRGRRAASRQSGSRGSS